MIAVNRAPLDRVCQGDIFRDVPFIEYVSETEDGIEYSKIIYPLVYVLTQDCDLEQDHRIQVPGSAVKNQDKMLLSVLVAPLYNSEHVFRGEHLSELGMQMMQIPKKRTAGTSLMNNETPRFHYLVFPYDIPIPPCIIDFKHYFSVNIAFLRGIKETHFVCQVSDLFREDVSLRFANFLSRIGLPEIQG